MAELNFRRLLCKLMRLLSYSPRLLTAGEANCHVWDT